MCTRQSRKLIWDMINTLFLTTVAVEPTFVAFFQHSQTHFHGLSCQFFQISLKKWELKITHNAFQDCRVHFSRQPFSKQLYTPSTFEKAKKFFGRFRLTSDHRYRTQTPVFYGVLILKKSSPAYQIHLRFRCIAFPS